MKVLIADDETITRIALRKHLRKWGYDVVEARDGKEAWEILSGDDPPRIAILDWMMPEMEGIEICRRLSHYQDIQFVYTILLTIRREKEDIIQALDSGAHDFLSKPVHTAELRARIAVGVRLVEAEEKLIETNQNMLASIRYAEKLQRSLLPDLDDVRLWLPQCFYIWEPKDIVGGDILYIDRLDDIAIFVVADCTGHGIPGAFITMIVSSAIRRIVKDERIITPSKILQRLSFIVKSSLQQHNESGKSNDGLDASICCVQGLTTGNPELTFSGAVQRLIYFDGDEMVMIKGDRHSLGYRNADVNFEFTNHRVPIRKGMQFYLFTDGFVDQFGGGNHQRFGMKRFKELLYKIRTLPFDRQEEMMRRTYNDFKESEDRLDDMTVLGFQI